ncbi:hypothetical protein [Terribacillus saccharophilus]|uniref:hypothetical protein n=1 Tax=Terribacillus saccharophilus TaxID=361277 RepID=UPI000BA54356|nr:hypothetical protein [Terribacillus saccharophilus]PAF19747.1 hypothetical protein CHH51_01405 [Terribacillus saccharophilus]
MPNVVSMFNKQNQDQQELISHIEELLQAAKNGDITSVLVAANNSDGNITTGYCNLDYGQKQTLISHAQLDVALQFVSANME